MSLAFLGGAGAFVGRASLRGRAGERVAGRIALDRVTSRLDFGRPGSSPASILVLRRLSCRLRGPPQAAADDPGVVRSLSLAAQEAIGAASATAVRATDAASASGAAAVYFADFAEFMACLVRDWLAGKAHSRWWWSAVLGNAPIEETILAYCRKRPEALPAMLENLAATSDAVRFVAAIRADAASLIQGVCDVFGLDHEVAALISSAPPPSMHAEPVHLRRLQTALPECAQQGLGRTAVALLALGLGLRRAPVAVRSPAFVEFVHGHVEPEPLLPQARQEANPGTMRAKHELEKPTGIETPPSVAAIFTVFPARSNVAEEAPSVRVSRVASTEARRGAMLLPPPAEPEVLSIVAGLPTLAVEAIPLPPVAYLADGTAAPGDESSCVELACETRFGGIFYVLNVALHMGYYGDFTQPRMRGLAVSPWDFLAVCGRTWFRRRFVADPVWRLLASLAGREIDEEPDASFDPDCLQRMQERIALALGEKRLRRAILRLVFADASVTDTGTHLDVHLSLDKLPLSVRYAGLDRDPGWIPAAGRVVAFHFD